MHGENLKLISMHK